MTNYRRACPDGATWFFTVNLADRRSNLLVERISLLRDAISRTRGRHPFRIDAMVVLPDHLHAVWSLPESDADYALRWRLIKTWFSRGLPKIEHRSASRASKGERGIWQRRYWEHLIRDDDDLQRHVDYVHFNPAKHGHVAQCADWPYSTFHRDVRCGRLPADWGVAADSPSSEFGERTVPRSRRMG